MKRLISYCDPVMRISSVNISEGLESKLQELREACESVIEKRKAVLQECEKSNSLPYPVTNFLKRTARYDSKSIIFLRSLVLSPFDVDEDDMLDFTNYAAFIEKWRNFDFDENQKRLRERAAKLMPELAEAFLRRPSPKL